MTTLSIVTVLALGLSTILAGSVFKLNLALGLAVVISANFLASALVRIFGLIAFTNVSTALTSVIVLVGLAILHFWPVIVAKIRRR